MANPAARQAPKKISDHELARRAAQSSASLQLPRQRAYSIPEAAEQLGVCRASVYKLIADGRLNPIKVGARRLIPDAQIATLLGE
jgi:excisionase family DNA binding protein